MGLGGIEPQSILLITELTIEEVLVRNTLRYQLRLSLLLSGRD